MKYDALIFDIDGTLWNACPATAEGWNLALKRLGAPRQISSNDVEKVAGEPFEQCVGVLFPGLSAHYPALLPALDLYEKKIVKREGGVFYEGIIEGIKRLSKHYEIFLVSNCQEWYLNLFLKFSGIRRYLKGFDCYGISEVPKYQMLLNIQNHYGLKSPMYIGDTDSDKEAAQQANINFIHVLYGFGVCERGCKSFVTFKELVSHLLRGFNSD